MAEFTNIEWTDSSFNPWWGCTKISPACDNCYAAALDHRTGGDAWGVGHPRRRTGESNWNNPIRWNKNADKFFAKHGRRQRVFCASMADVFDNEVDPQWRTDLFRLIAATPNLDWLILTKRIGNAMTMLADATAEVEFSDASIPKYTSGNPWPNVWLGATICNQEEADRDIPKLLAVPAAKRFLSIEPMLGPIDLPGMVYYGTESSGGIVPLREKGHIQLDWVICGGESGHGARPMHPEWVRSLRDQCAEAKVPFLFKQWGEWASRYTTLTEEKMVFRQFTSHQSWVNKASTWVNGGICLDKNGLQLSNGGDFRLANEQGNFPVTIMHKVGKKAAGRLLDGVDHNGSPL